MGCDVKESIVCLLWRFSLSLSYGSGRDGIWDMELYHGVSCLFVCLIDFARRVSMLARLPTV
jgi:hypothetical protein